MLNFVPSSFFFFLNILFSRVTLLCYFCSTILPLIFALWYFALLYLPWSGRMNVITFALINKSNRVPIGNFIWSCSFCLDFGTGPSWLKGPGLTARSMSWGFGLVQAWHGPTSVRPVPWPLPRHDGQAGSVWLGPTIKEAKQMREPK